MSGRERMRSAYRGERSVEIPVSPELWDAAALDLLPGPFHEHVGPWARRPFWRLLLDVHRHYLTDAWVVLGAGPYRRTACERHDEHRFVDEATIETISTWRVGGGELRTVSRTTRTYAGWKVEHPVKDLERELPLWERCFFGEPADLETGGIAEAIEATGDDGLVTVAVGELFTSFLASTLEGGTSRALLALADSPSDFERLRDRYAAHLGGVAAAAIDRAGAEAVFLNSGYTQLPVMSPAMYREWDVPVLRAVCAAAHSRGASVHLHNHGPILPILGDIVGAGIDIVCGLFSPPAGDVADLAGLAAEVVRLSSAAGRRPLALKGMIDPFGALLNGTPVQVEAEVRAQLDATAGIPFILGTQDGTLPGTPGANLVAMVRAGRAWRAGS